MSLNGDDIIYIHEKSVVEVNENQNAPDEALRVKCENRKNETKDKYKNENSKLMKKLDYITIEENIQTKSVIGSELFKEQVVGVKLVKKKLHENSKLNCERVYASLQSNNPEYADYHNPATQEERRKQQDQQHGYPTTAPATTSPISFPGTN